MLEVESEIFIDGRIKKINARLTNHEFGFNWGIVRNIYEL